MTQLDRLAGSDRLTRHCQGAGPARGGAREGVRGVGAPASVGVPRGPASRPAQPGSPSRAAGPTPPAARQGFTGPSLVPLPLGTGARACTLADPAPGVPDDGAEHVQVLSAELLAAACAEPVPVEVPAVSAGAVRPAPLARRRRGDGVRRPSGRTDPGRGAVVAAASFLAAIALGFGGVVHAFLAIPDTPVEPGQGAVVQVDHGH